MKKLKLEQLGVGSFRTAAQDAESGRGTVLGRGGCTHLASCPCNTRGYVRGTARSPRTRATSP